MTTERLRQVTEAADFVRARGAASPRIGVVLGSGLGRFTERLERATSLPYSSIPHMPRTTVSGHPGELALGSVRGVDVACLRGRVHLYEGYAPERVAFGVRLLAELGCQVVLLTNAAGAVAVTHLPGDLMLVLDHINLTGGNPLVGHITESGPDFVDMTHAYDPRLAQAARDAARELRVPLPEGVYAGVLGPSYETPAEIRMLDMLGAHAVGMSTVPEVIALRQLGVTVGAISCITNSAAGRPQAILDHEHVQAVAERAHEQLANLMERWIEVALDTLVPGNAGAGAQ